MFTISGNNKGLRCPFKSNICQEGFCMTCQIYLDWREQGQIVVICAWCGQEMGRKPGLGQSGVSHGLCPECEEKHFPEGKGSTMVGKETSNARL